MKLTKEQFTSMTQEMSKNIGLELNEQQLQKIYIYKEMLLEWNEKINLTAITDDEEIVAKHIIDSLQIVRHIKENQKVIDVGTGAGLPGIIIAIYFEGKIKITLFDALNKRIVFLNEVINKLNLVNVEAVHGRAEDSSRDEKYRETYDIVVSRAVARLNILMELTAQFTNINGHCIYMKADRAYEELQESNNAQKQLGLKYINGDNYTINLRDELHTRTILTFKKQETTKKQYPRQYSKIKKAPL